MLRLARKYLHGWRVWRLEKKFRRAFPEYDAEKENVAVNERRHKSTASSWRALSDIKHAQLAREVGRTA